MADEWILGQPVETDETNEEWALGQPRVVIDDTAAAPAGNAGIMTTNTGYWGPTFS
jgi:hypothetical protein